MEKEQIQVYKYHGYNIDDRRYQVNGKTSKFNSKHLLIECLYEKHLYRNNYLTTCINAHNTELHVGQIFNQTGSIKTTHVCHICCENGIRISISINPVENDPSQPISNSIIFSMTWPNGLRIASDYCEASRLKFVQQIWKHSTTAEKYRENYSNGCVVKYLHNGTVIIFTSTGAIYQTFQISNDNQSNENFSNLEMVECDLDAENMKFQNEITFLEFLRDKNNVDSFKMTTTCGRQYLIENGQIVAKLNEIYCRENFDYIYDENYIRREDGLKIIYNSDGTICMYPDGTKITTEFDEILLSNDFDQDLGKNQRKSLDESQLELNAIENRIVSSFINDVRFLI